MTKMKHLQLNEEGATVINLHDLGITRVNSVSDVDMALLCEFVKHRNKWIRSQFDNRRAWIALDTEKEVCMLKLFVNVFASVYSFLIIRYANCQRKQGH